MGQGDEASQVTKEAPAEAAEEPKVGFATVAEKLLQQHDTDTHTHTNTRCINVEPNSLACARTMSLPRCPRWCRRLKQQRNRRWVLTRSKKNCARAMRHPR